MTDALVIDREFARELLVKETRNSEDSRNSAPREASDSAQSVAAGERVLERLNEQLLRWFGKDGVDALLVRALVRTQREHRVLVGVQRRSPASLRLTGIVTRAGQSAQAPSSDEVAEAIIALVATILALIGRLVGDDMTRHLVRQIWPDTKSGSPIAGNGSTNERLDK